jgi:hypothetical protein
LPPFPNILSPSHVPFCFVGLFINYLFVFIDFLVGYYFFSSCIFCDKPVRALLCALSCFCLGSSWAHCHWFLLLGRLVVALIERRLSL